MPRVKQGGHALMDHLTKPERQHVLAMYESLVLEGYDKNLAMSLAIKAAAEQNTSTENHPKVEYFVLQHPRGWAVRKLQAKKPSYVFARKEEAVERAMDLAKEHQGLLVIYKEDGTIQTRRNYGKP